jgi:hypothetical protein
VTTNEILIGLGLIAAAAAAAARQPEATVTVPPQTPAEESQ